MKKTIVLATLVAGLGVSACAKKSDQIAAAYVSPLAYQSHSCGQLRQEAVRVSARVSEASGIQNQKAQNDAVATGVALVVFWPAAFFIKGDRETAAELSRLKGEMEAIEKASVHKNCGITFQRQPANRS